MKKLIFFILILVSFSIKAQQVITVVNAQGPTQSMTAQIMLVIDEANRIQNKYRFVQEFKPGGFESIGVKFMLESPTNRLVTITNASVEGESRGFIDLNELTPVFSHGDACWMVITNFGDLSKGKEYTVGGPAIGGATHLIALQAGKKYNVPVRYVVYRSNYDALINMAADDHSVTFAMDRPINYKQLIEKNPRLQAVALSCPDRDPDYPTVKTLKELNINAPSIWQFTMASDKMPAEQRKEIAEIFKQVYLIQGAEKMRAVSDFVSPVYRNETAAQHYTQSISTLKKYRRLFAKEIEQPN